jgi:two-component system cell cycle sensor histidine kinase/response regulator CckA
MTGESSGHPAQPRSEAPGRRRRHLLAFFAGTVLIATLTGFHIWEKEKAAIAYWQDQQSTIADDRARLISSWLGERQADTELLSLFPSVHQMLCPVETSGSSADAGGGELKHLSAFMDQVAFTHGYAAIYLVSPEGGVVARSATSESMSLAVIEKARQVSQGNTFWVGPLGETQVSSFVYFVSPVLGHVGPETGVKLPSSCPGAFVLQIDPRKSLFPILSGESVATRSGETLLLQRQGKELVYFSPLRGAPLQQGFLRRPLAASTAEPGREEKSLSGERLDYRGVPVLSAATRIPLTDWILVRKIDRKEALRDFYAAARLEAMAGAGIVLVFVYLLVGYRRKMLARAQEESTAHQQAILALQAFAQEMVDNVPVGLLVLSPDLNVLSANRTFLEGFHVPPEKVIGQPLPEVIQAEGPPGRIIDATGLGNGPHDVLLDLAALGGTGTRPTRLTLTEISSGQGKGRLLLTVEDQTESERLRAAAEASERRLRELVQSIDAIVWEADAKTHQFTFVSRRAEQILGYPVEQWLTQADFWVEHLHPLDREQALGARLKAMAEGRDHSLEYRVLAADGRQVWLHDTTHVVLDAERRPIQLRGVAIDSTKEEQAQAERMLLITAIEQSAEGIVITDARGTIEYVNPAFSRVSGYSRAEALGKNPRILKSGKQDESYYRKLWTTILGGEIWQDEITNCRSDGRLYTERMTIAPVRDQRGEITHFIAVKAEVTERKRLEQQLRQAQKMEAVGRLAGGVAHDFNNMLTIISGYSGLLLEHPDMVEPLRAYVNEIRGASGRAASLTRQLLAFSRQQVLAPRVLDLNAVVANIEKMLKRLIGEDIDLVTVLGESLWPIKADPGQLEQVLLNLVVNARDAMPNGGVLTLETSNVEMDSTFAQSHFPHTPGPYVLLAVSDTGMGMDAETQARIFEPFFTTKEKGKGTGLGLAMVYGIVKQSGGYIWVYSEVGKGTAFKIYLPRSEDEVDEAIPGRSGVDAQQGTETLLLVEDEEAVRTLVRNVLRKKGYRVLEASQGEEALEFSELYRGRIDLLVTDVVMPQMNGRELARRLVKSRPEIKVLYISGYADNTVWSEGGLDSSGAFLQKPFSPEALARKVREVLGGPPHPGF